MAAPIRVSALYRYPIKSCAPEALSVGRVEERGFAGDRRWMLVDGEGRFLSQRTRPELSRIAAVPVEADQPDKGLQLSHRDGAREPLLVSPPGEDQPERSISLWDDRFSVRLADPATQQWVQSVLDPSVQLVHMGPTHVRTAAPSYAGPDREVSFADGFPYLVLSQASMDELNQRLAEQGHPALDILRFRPNIVLDGSSAHAEDGWRRIRFGGGDTGPILRLVKPCARCRLTTLDTQTMTYGAEPLQTLATYRQQPSGGPYGRGGAALKGVFFGMNAVVEQPGLVHAGDTVEVLE